MTAPSEVGRPQKGRGPAKVSTARNLIGLVLLVGLVVVGGLEVVANRQFQAAVQKLDKGVGNEEGDLMTEADVEKLIGRKADGPGTDSGGMVTKSYTWRGLVRKYTVQAEYRKGPDVLSLVNFEAK